MIGLGLGLNKYRFMGGGIPENTVRPLISNITNPSNNPAAVGDDLFVSDGTWVGAAPITFAYQWYRNGVPIVGATADTYTLVTADENKTIKAKVFATDNDANTNSKFASNSFTVEGEPVNVTAPLITGSAQRGSTLSVTDGTWIGIPSPTFTYQWYRGVSAIGGATNNTYVTVTADIGEQISCEVTADNGIGSPVTQASSNSITVTQIPINTVAPVISGNTTLGSTLTTTNGTWTGTATITFGYQWKRNGTNISGATNSTYVLAVADSAANITCEVTGTNSIGSASAVSNTITADTYTLANTVAPVISGSTTFGSVLTTTDGIWTGASPITFAYQWKRNGTPIASANASTYTLVVADSTANITCDVTATNPAGSLTQGSNTITAANFIPTNTVAPTLTPSGSQVTGTVITLGNGTWTGASPITYEYRWTRDNVVISGETANTYTILAGDDGTVIKGEVRATNAAGVSAYVTTSNQVDASDIPVFVGILDAYPLADYIYAPARFVSAYTGDILRVRRNGNDELDIPYLANGEMDIAALESFVVAGGGSEFGRVPIWYNQGSGNDVLQATAGNQPFIASSGSVITQNGKPTVQHQAGNQELKLASADNLGNEYKIFGVIKIDGSGFNNEFLGSSTPSFSYGIYSDGSGFYHASNGAFGNNSSPFGNTFALVTISRGGTTTITPFKNGVTLGSSFTISANNDFYLSSLSGEENSLYNLIGNMSAVVIYKNGINNTQRQGIETALMTYFSL